MLKPFRNLICESRGKTLNIAIAVMSQNKLHVFVARFIVPYAAI